MVGSLGGDSVSFTDWEPNNIKLFIHDDEELFYRLDKEGIAYYVGNQNPLLMNTTSVNPNAMLEPLPSTI